MIPSAANSDYPKFVPDQVLTSDNLNDLFGYLDEQGRMTRTNLIGIGIVCGLIVKTAADGSSITITKGVGVTSSGYLVTVPEIVYTKRTTEIFDAVKCEYYSRFVDTSTKTQKFDLWELKQDAETEGITPLSNTFLNDGEKIVLIFVELLEENNKNCDPDSCDDKGIMVTVNFRPLLIEKANVGTLLSGTPTNTDLWLALPEIAMQRFDVKATVLFECLNIFNAYGKILNNTFLTKTQLALTDAYNILKPVLLDDFPTNPFATLANDFKFLNDGSISTSQLIAVQYYYDLFADLLFAYNELRKTGTEIIGECCPDDNFPRHLLLDLAIPDTTVEFSSYRHYFIPSPISGCRQKAVLYVKILFKKLLLLVQKFSVPPPTILGANKKLDANIRITPSVLANVPFSTKTIPYYYNIANATDSLLKNWSPEKSVQNKITRNLSYHAVKYNTTDDDIRRPLLYDLEPYNFLRVEGHIGKSYKHVVKNITNIRDQHRLPFEIVALSADITAVIDFIKDLGKLLTTGNGTTQATLESLTGSSCQFSDLELLYDSIMAELTNKLSNEMKFFYDLKRDAKRPPLPPPASNVPQAPLLKKTDPAFRFGTNTIGHEFEIYYATVKNLPFIPIQVFFQSVGQGGNTDLIDFLFKGLLYYIEQVFDTVTTSLSSFNFFNFYIRYFTMLFTVRYIKALNKLLPEQFPLSEEENDHLDALLSISADGRILQLYMEFLRRILQVKIMQQAGYYAICHPGIQHKAGVPMGGTFIVVYHEAKKTENTETANAAGNEAVAFNIADKRTFEPAKASELKFAADATPQEHLQMFASGIDDRVMLTKEKMITGLQKSFTGGITKTENAKTEFFGVSEKATVESKGTVLAIAESAQGAKQNSLNYIIAAATYLKNRQADVLDEVIEDINDGAVIADFYLPYICCSDCPPVQMIVMGSPEKTNQGPNADAGKDDSEDLVLDESGKPHAIVNLDGSKSSDPEHGTLIFSWIEKSNSPAVNIDDKTKSDPGVDFTAAGTFTFELTVTDDAGNKDADEVIITINEMQLEPANLEIVGKPGPYCNNKSGLQIRLLATPAGGNFTSEPAGVNVQTDANGFFFMPESLSAGNYKLNYSFADGRKDTITFSISQAFNVEFISAEAKLVIAGNATFFDLTFKVTEIAGAHYQWDFKIDTGVAQSKETDTGVLIVRVTREQRRIAVAVSVAQGPCSGQTKKTFDIQQLIRDSQ